MTNVLRAALAVTIAGTAAARPRADTCGTPNTAAASCQCNGATYDFSQIKPYYNYPYFAFYETSNDHHYLQMVDGGFQCAGGCHSDPLYCDQDYPIARGTAIVLKMNVACHNEGVVAGQKWAIDTSVSPQVISITFPGGEKVSTLNVTCNQSATYSSLTYKYIDPRTAAYFLSSKFACDPNAPPPTPPPTPPPPPPPPPPRYRCLVDHCEPMEANYTGPATNLSNCEAFCGPPYYHCIADKCEQSMDPGITNRTQCEQICGK